MGGKNIFKNVRWENIISIGLPLFILLFILIKGTILNIFGYSFNLNVGADSDIDCSKNICISHLGGLGPIQKYGDISWRDFRNSTPVKLAITDSYLNSEKGNYYKFNLSGDGVLEYRYYTGNKYIWRPVWKTSWDNYIHVESLDNFDKHFNGWKLFVNPIKYYEACDNELFLDGMDDNTLRTFNLELKNHTKMLIYFKDGVSLNFVGDGYAEIKKGTHGIASFDNEYKSDLSGYFFVDYFGNLDSMIINSNKFVILDKIQTSSWNSFALNLSTKTNYTVLSNVDQSVSFSNIPMLNLEADNPVTIELNPGSYKLNIEKSGLNVIGQSFYLKDHNSFDHFAYLECIKDFRLKHFNFSNLNYSDKVYFIGKSFDFTSLINRDTKGNTNEWHFINKSYNNKKQFEMNIRFENYMELITDIQSDAESFDITVRDENDIIIDKVKTDSNVNYALNLPGVNFLNLEISAGDRFILPNIQLFALDYCVGSVDKFRSLKCRGQTNNEIFNFKIDHQTPDYLFIGKDKIDTFRSNGDNLSLYNIMVMVE